MSVPSPLQKWRSLRSERFDIALSKYRHLLEVGSDENYAAKTSALDKAAIQVDPRREEMLKKKSEKRTFEAKRSKLDTLARLRELTAIDFNMTGGAAPTGTMSGGGGDSVSSISSQNRN